MPPLDRRAVTERPAAREPSRLSIVVLSALVAGGVGAFLVVKLTQYAEKPQDSAPTAGMVATAAEPPAVAPASEPRPIAPPAAIGEPHPPPQALEVAVASPTRTVAHPEAANIPDKTGSKRRAQPSHAAKAAVARAKLEPETHAEASRSEPRTEDKPAPDADKSEVAKADALDPETPAGRTSEPETSESPRPVAAHDPPAAAPRPGAIDVAATRAAVRAQIGPVQQCYERARMDDANLAGTILARITVAPDGSVQSIEIVKSTLGAPQVEACIRQGISHWQLPKPGGGVSASLTYPLVFQ